MTQPREPVVSEILRRIRRSVRNGQRLHLDENHARYLMQPRIYAHLATIEAEEWQAIWKEEDAEEPVSEPNPGTASPRASGEPGVPKDQAALIGSASRRRLAKTLAESRQRAAAKRRDKVKTNG